MFKVSEEEFLQQISELEVKRKLVKEEISSLRKTVLDKQSELIFFTLKKEKLEEDLRLLKVRSINVEPSKEDLDLERFRQVLPKYLKKI